MIVEWWLWKSVKIVMVVMNVYLMLCVYEEVFVKFVDGLFYLY